LLRDYTAADFQHQSLEKSFELKGRQLIDETVQKVEESRALSMRLPQPQ
jgi:hypothetical protein